MDVYLNINQLDYSIENTQILSKISLDVNEGEFVGLIGPNGCGKSTLLKNIYRTYQPKKNVVYIGGKDVLGIAPKELAKMVSVVAQENSVAFDVEVIDMVMYGRYAHHKFLECEKQEDLELCYHYIQEVGLSGYEHRSFLSLSGGEKQRVFLARALVQQSRLIILDEPTNHLDVRYQYLLMQILKKQNVTIFSSIHDLNLASIYCDRILIMDHGKITAAGTPEEVLTEENIAHTFGVRTQITINEVTKKIQVYYLPENL